MDENSGNETRAVKIYVESIQVTPNKTSFFQQLMQFHFNGRKLI